MSSIPFELMVKEYLSNITHEKEKEICHELEIRFGTTRSLSKFDFDNVVQKISSNGFTCSNMQGQHLLRISPEQNEKIAKQRLEIVGIDLITLYSQYETLESILHSTSYVNSKESMDMIKFTVKSEAMTKTNIPMKRVVFDDFGFHVSYQYEKHSTPKAMENQSIIASWKKTKKTFRYMNRVKFIHPTYPIIVDMSIIRSSKKSNKYEYIPEYTMNDVHLFENKETYEIEFEIDNEKVKKYTLTELLQMIRKHIKLILSALQESPFPIGTVEINNTSASYLQLISQDKKNIPLNFIGPNPITLQMEHIMKNGIVHKGYSVTDKADGKRCLLYITTTGRIYYIDTNMKIMYTGCEMSTREYSNTLLDGEFIKYDKYGNHLNLFASFDIYYLKNTYVGNLKLMERIQLMETLINHVHFQTFRIKCKKFIFPTNIFNACQEILSNSEEYMIDGLIFTPIHSSVGGLSSPLTTKMTWHECFKWKPMNQNTIDFLVRMKYDERGEIIRGTIDLHGIQYEYHTIELFCGYATTHGSANPFIEVLSGHPQPLKIGEYVPVKFYPTNPLNSNACYCQVIITDGVMLTEKKEYFTSDMIVEFRYDIEKEGSWKWIPVCVRYDKTTQLHNSLQNKLGGKISKPNFGNSYQVANSNWTSIHHAITISMITTGDAIPTSNDRISYYNKTNLQCHTKGLRTFHNIHIKRKLISGVSFLLHKPKKTLLDYSVGKAGDLHKWIDSDLSFVFGIDIVDDNIQNPLDGACVRYLQEKKKLCSLRAIFVVGDTSLNIRDGSAFALSGTDIHGQLSNAIFGIGENTSIFKNVHDHYGIGSHGFDISSVQFSIHYFFQNSEILHGFLKNICECTALGGYFIGTCYDGQTIFNKLMSRNIHVMTKGTNKKMLEIKRLYTQTTFSNDETCLGYTIDVWQDSINQYFQEYLVHFPYLVSLMSRYGFSLITKDETHQMKIPHASGLFDEMFESSMEMTEEEKEISFMNRYFIFKKQFHPTTL